MVSTALQLVMVVLLMAAVAQGASASSGMCLDATECGSSQCCRVGFGRYVSPTCSPLGDVGSYCRQNQAEDFDLGYPNGLVLNVKGGYYGFCPCRPGLICCRKTAMCALPESCFPGILTNQDDFDESV